MGAAFSANLPRQLYFPPDDPTSGGNDWVAVQTDQFFVATADPSDLETHNTVAHSDLEQAPPQYELLDDRSNARTMNRLRDPEDKVVTNALLS